MYKNRHTEMHIDTCKHPHPHIYIERHRATHTEIHQTHIQNRHMQKHMHRVHTDWDTHSICSIYYQNAPPLSSWLCNFIQLLYFYSSLWLSKVSCVPVARFLYLLIWQWAPIARSLSLISVTVLKYPPKPGTCPQANVMEVCQSRVLFPRCSCLG